jgi:hypothetical protein
MSRNSIMSSNSVTTTEGVPIEAQCMS